MISPLVGTHRPERYQVVAFDEAGNRVGKATLRRPDPRSAGRPDCGRLQSELSVPVGGYLMLEHIALAEAEAA